MDTHYIDRAVHRRVHGLGEILEDVPNYTGSIEAAWSLLGTLCSRGDIHIEIQCHSGEDCDWSVMLSGNGELEYSYARAATAPLAISKAVLHYVQWEGRGNE